MVSNIIHEFININSISMQGENLEVEIVTNYDTYLC